MPNLSRELDNARWLIEKAITKGYVVSVNDGEAYPIKRSDNADKICAALQSTDSDMLIFRDKNHGQRIGWVLLIWGNGDDLISDYTDNPLTNELVID